MKLDIMERCILSSSSAYYSEKGSIYHVWQSFLRSRSKVNEQSGEVSGDKTWDQTVPETKLKRRTTEKRQRDCTPRCIPDLRMLRSYVYTEAFDVSEGRPFGFGSSGIDELAHMKGGGFTHFGS